MPARASDGISRIGFRFASPNAVFNLSTFSVRWLRLAIQFEPSMPSNPQRNTAASLAN
jgi:hypothetical protein